MNEEWKDIPGYEGLYEASTLGRIRTNANKVTSNAKYPVRHWKQRIMKQKYQPRCTGKKDARVCLWKDGKEKTFLVARLIALTWCEGYAEGMTVNHIDGNPNNNRADNLEWVSLADNIRHGYKTGLYNNCMKPVTVEVNGEKLSFPSIAAASRCLGKSKFYIKSLVSTGRSLSIER